MTSGLLLTALLLGALPELDRGVAQYDALEYEAAIVTLKKAEPKATSLTDRTRLLLYLGLSHAELAQWKEAEAAFRNVLVLDPSARLPVKNSPKIGKRFDDLRAQFAVAAHGVPPVADPVAVTTAAPLPDESVAAPADSGVPLRPALLLGGGLVAAGGGVALGLMASGAADRAESSSGKLIGASACFAAATALVVAAVIDYLTPSEEQAK